MTLSEIKQAIAEGKKVHWSNEIYEVVKDNIGQYLIECISNKHCIGLTWNDGVTLNGKPEDFYIHEDKNIRTIPNIEGYYKHLEILKERKQKYKALRFISMSLNTAENLTLANTFEFLGMIVSNEGEEAEHIRIHKELKAAVLYKKVKQEFGEEVAKNIWDKL